MRAFVLLPLAAAVLAAPERVAAAPLSLAGLDSMSQALASRALCYAPVGRDACLATCPALDPAWERNGSASVDAVDRELALLEYWDGGAEREVCHVVVVGGATVVRTGPICTPPVDCAKTPADVRCADLDADGLRAWQEALSRTADTRANAACRGPLDCQLSEACRLAYGAGDLRCVERACAATGCKVFRVEPVSVTSGEVIAHVFFDYSPMPATVLDLKLEYSAETLELLDARPLPLLEAAGKAVSVSHLPTGELRLVVTGTGTLAPVPHGAIIELVFLRTDSTRRATVAFSDDPVHRRYSVAPEQGLAQAGLADASAWGPAIEVPAAGAGGDRALLTYTFDDPAAPLSVKNVTSPAVLCTALGSACKGGLGSLEALQQGTILGGSPIEGVRAKGTYLRGGQDHLRFPLTHDTAAERSFTLSLWFYAEAAFAATPRQLLFSHLAQDERTSFGLELTPEPDGTVDLVWFEGQFDSGAVRVVVRDRLPRLRWAHVAVVYDAVTAQVSWFVDGVPAGTRAFAQGLACPQVQPGLVIHAQDNSDVVYLARAENGLDRLARTDPLGLGAAAVLTSGPYGYRDPDYNAVADKIAYVSNESGAYEVWVTNRRGQERRQLTKGFGDTSLGVFARKPRWAPKGNALVFESNAYSATDNPTRVYRLRYLRLDQLSGTQMLTYGSEPADAILATDAGSHATGAAWLNDSQGRGEIVYTESSADLRTRGVRRLSLDGGALPAAITLDAPDPTPGETAELLDAHVSRDGTVTNLLVARTWSSSAPTDQFRATVVTTAPDLVEVRVTFEPSGYAPNCWDRNHDGVLDIASEDLDLDGLATVADCYPSSVHDLSVSYDPRLAHNATLDRAGLDIEAPGGLAKLVEVSDRFTPSEGLVQIDVSGPLDDRPLKAGIELATIAFDPKGVVGAPAFVPKTNHRRSAVYVKTLNGPTRELDVAAHLHDARAGAFSPDGTTALLAGLNQSRPTLIRVDLSGATPPMRLGQDESVIDSLSYRRQEQLMACNWMGAYRDRYTGLYRGAFTGGLDEVSLYNYPRPEAALRSEAQRGHEWLAKAGRDGGVDATAPLCNVSDVECPRYMMCNRARGVCETVPCAAGSPSACSRGLCTARPVGSPGEAAFVCTAECSTDSECFSKECLNGPCRFCDRDTATCVECRQTVTKTGPGAPPILAVEGCPDRNSYSCQDGNCYSECYAFDGGQSQFLCRAPVEQCEHGRCVTSEWTWDNLAPATLLGVEETGTGNGDARAFHQIAVSNRIPIRIQAFGVSDYLHPPQVAVHGCLAGACFEIGEIAVDNRTSALEHRPWYVLSSPWKLDQLRLRLVVPPHDNVAGEAGGVASSAGCPAGVPIEQCANAPPGSLYALGYPAEVPHETILAAGGVVDSHPARVYLRPGSPAVVVLGVEVQGTTYRQPTSDSICSYEGSPNPVEARPDPADPTRTLRRLRRMVFGPAERSNQRTRWVADGGVWDPAWSLVSLQAAGWAVLNCAYANPAVGTAEATYTVFVSSPQDAAMNDDGVACTYRASGKPCFQWEYRPTADLMSIDGQVLFKTLEFEDGGSLGP